MEKSSNRLYRIINFHHAVQIFEQEELYFSHPSRWEDPYETPFNDLRATGVFAQSWCTNPVSDAMWRIYSLNHLGIRIGTSVKKLDLALREATQNTDIKIRMEKVAYYSQQEINERIKK